MKYFFNIGLICGLFMTVSMPLLAFDLPQGAAKFQGANTSPGGTEVKQKFQAAYESCQQQLQAAQQKFQGLPNKEPEQLMIALREFNSSFNTCLAKLGIVSYLFASQV